LKIEVHRHSQLSDAKEYAKRVIDEAAEAARLRYLTAGSGQALEYEAAAKEAERYVEGEPGAYPMLQADVDAGLSADLAAAAASVLYMRAQFGLVGATVRSVRLGAKCQVDQATTQAQVAQLREAAVATLAAL
jgi:hypothetical protein